MAGVCGPGRGHHHLSLRAHSGSAIVAARSGVPTDAATAMDVSFIALDFNGLLICNGLVGGIIIVCTCLFDGRRPTIAVASCCAW